VILAQIKSRIFKVILLKEFDSNTKMNMSETSPLVLLPAEHFSLKWVIFLHRLKMFYFHLSRQARVIEHNFVIHMAIL